MRFSGVNGLTVMPRGRSNRTNHAREKFLGVLAETCNVSEAARAAGVSRRSVYDWRDADPAFAADWAEAEETAVDSLEAIAWQRAKDGLSDRMLEILLKAHRSKYREKQALEVTGTVHHDHTIEARAEVEEIFGAGPYLAVSNG